VLRPYFRITLRRQDGAYCQTRRTWETDNCKTGGLDVQKTDHLQKVLWALTSLVLLFCTTAHGQIITSTILGHVNDSSGAAIPGAEVAITNQGTSITSKTATDSVGDYSLSGLEAGTYTVSVTQKGFETSQTTGVVLTNQATQRVDVALKVGSPTQMITVTGEKVSMVHTDTVTVGTAFHDLQLGEIPLQNDTIDSLDKMIPGYMFGQILSNSRVNGGVYIGSLNYTMNGAETNDQANGGMPYGHNTYAAALPTPESMQEYRVDTINTNADYARSTTISMLTRNGTNQLHGDFEELNADAFLSANAFQYDGTIINGKPEPKPGYNRNQFQGNIGGPVKRDRIWLFGNFSYYDERAYTGESLVIPTLAMQGGNFGALCTSGVYGGNGVCTSGVQLYNPATGAPYAGNVIPKTSFTSQSNTLLSYLPAPNIVGAGAPNPNGLPSGAADFLTQNRTAHDMPVTNDRADFKLTEKDLLYATYTRAGATAYLEANAYPQTYGQDVYPPTNTQVTMAETHTFSPTMVNEFRGSWFDRTVVEVGINLGFNPQTLFPGLQPTYNRGLPTMNMTGYTGMFHDVGNLPHAHVPSVEFTDNLTKVHGRHTMKFGVDELGIKAYGKPQPGGLGTFTFNGEWTGGSGWKNGGVSPSSGNAFADFLLGDASGTNYVVPSTFGNNVYDRIWGLYAQDTWQATSRLTIYFGLRYEYQLPWGYQTDGGVGIDEYFNPPTDQIALPENSSTPFFPPVNASQTQYNAYLPELTTTQALGLKQQWETPDKTNFAPRLGFAYRPFHNNNTVIRAAYGVYYDQVSAGIYEGAYSSPPWLSNAAGSGLAFSSGLTGTPPASGYQPDLTFSNPFPGAGVYKAPANPTVTYIDKNFVRTAVQQWNVTLEHQFPGQWLGTMTYFGNQTHHIPWYNNDIDIPATMTPGATLQSQLPYQPFAAVDSFRSGGKQNFDELQIQLQKRFSNGLTVQSYYNYEHSLDNVEGNSDATEPPDWHNVNADYGNTTFVRRQSFNIAYLYQLPVGKGQHFMGGAHGVVNAIVGGWEWSGDTTYGSGIPFTMTFTVPSTAANIGWFGQNTSPSVANRANLLTGVPIYAGQSHGHNTIAGVPWFNQSAFTAPPQFTWGDSSRDAYFGPGWGDWDMALLKNFNIPGREGMRLQFRIEANNIWNHYNTGNPGTASSAFGSYTQLAAPQFGGAQPTSTQGLITGCYPNCTFGGPYGQGNRYFQVGAKLYF
jgi:hypothetical protein